MPHQWIKWHLTVRDVLLSTGTNQNVEHGCLVPDVVPFDHGKDINLPHVKLATPAYVIRRCERSFYEWTSLNHLKNVLSCVNRSYHLPSRLHRNSWIAVIWHHTQGRKWIRLSAGMYSVLTRKKTTLFSGHFLRNRSTLDIGVLGYIGNIRNTLPKSGTFLLGHPVYLTSRILWTNLGFFIREFNNLMEVPQYQFSRKSFKWNPSGHRQTDGHEGGNKRACKVSIASWSRTEHWTSRKKRSDRPVNTLVLSVGRLLFVEQRVLLKHFIVQLIHTKYKILRLLK